MWSTISNVYRSAVPICHACRHQVNFYRYHTAIHSQRSSKFLYLKSATAYFRLMREQPGNFGKLATTLRGQGHLNGMEFGERQTSIGIHTELPNTRDNCIESKTTFENKKLKYALHRESCKHISNVHGQDSDKVNTWLYDLSELETIKDINRKSNILKCLTAIQRRKCACTVGSVKQSKHKRLVCVGYIPLSGKLCDRKTNYCTTTHCSIHTSVERACSQSGNGSSIRKEPPWRILFFGTDDIALHTLKYLYNDMMDTGTLVESLEVVTVNEQRAVRSFAENVQLKIHEWPVAIETEKYDVGVLVSFGHLIPDAVIHMFPYGILNMHPSLLPRWRGASPLIHTVLNGDKLTGVSVMEIRPKHFDIGPILLQRKCTVPHRCTSFQLADILGPFGASMMLECLKDLPTLERYEHEQTISGITYAHKLKHKNANIDWENNTAEEIDCQYRAISELIALKTEMNEHTLKLYDVVDPSHLQEINRQDVRGYHGDIFSAEPGTVVYHKPLKCIVVKCKSGLIGFKTVVLRKKLTAIDFFNGYITKNTCTKFTSLDNDLNKYVKEEKIPVQSKI